jgi:hypothetical protein
MITLPLIRANVVDAQGDIFTTEACKQLVADWHAGRSVTTVARDFTPNPKAVGRVVGMHFDGATVWVELDKDAAALVEAEDLEAAAGGYFPTTDPVDGVRTVRQFTLDRIALVTNKVCDNVPKRDKRH